MRYFWSFIAVLAVVTAGLNMLRRSQSSAALMEVAAPAAVAARPVGPVEQPASRPEPVSLPVAEVAQTPVIETPVAPALEVAPVAEPEVVATAPDAGREEPAPAAVPLSLDALLGVVAEAAEKLPAAVEPQTMPEPVADAPGPVEILPAPEVVVEEPKGPVGPAFSVKPDGSIEVAEAGVISGDGTQARPFVIDWQVLRSVARDYNPKQGQSEIPAWVMQLHGKRVRVEGNTLLPVVAEATNELLVMQNPWDGCCVGVPPTPYDAIEVKLAKMQSMGNAPTGFGMVEGTFKVDPYVVSGWLLGLYLIEDASFESAAGMALPEI